MTDKAQGLDNGLTNYGDRAGHSSLVAHAWFRAALITRG
jgi:hypothetical protein